MPRCLLTELVDLIVPPACVSCYEPDFSDGVICTVCAGRMNRLRGPSCTRCATPSNEKMHGCSQCRRYNWVQDSVTAAFAYDGSTRKLITSLKSRRSCEVAEFMASYMETALAQMPDIQVAVPVPTSHRRMRKFGYSQSELLSTALSAKIGIPSASNLLKRGDSQRQVGLARRERLEHASKTFSMNISIDPPEDVLLVDDVITTCATMASCASALKSGGVRTVHCIAFARTL